jgi:hypothetical protein
LQNNVRSADTQTQESPPSKHHSSVKKSVADKIAASPDRISKTDATPSPQDTSSAAEETKEIVKENETASPLSAANESLAPEFNLRVPESAEMQMEISQVKVNGSSTSGVGTMLWSVKNGKYAISIEAGLDLLITTLNLYKLSSEGNIDTFGLTPLLNTEARRNKAQTAIHFNPDDKTIIFSSSNKTVPMENGVQDIASLLFQLASIGYADGSQFSPGREFTMQVAEGRDATQFNFKVIGEEEIDSKLAPETGKIKTVHIVRPPRPGSYNSQLDIWLAPPLGWYPIQIRNTESSGVVTTQTVVKLKQKLNMDQ